MTVASETLLSWAFALVIGALAFVVFDCGNVREVHAEDSPQLLLARACAGETAWDAHDECSAIGHVLLRRGFGYSGALTSGKRRWVTELDPSGARPASWPARLSWERWRPRWLALYAHAGRVVRGEARASCAPDHFGSPTEIAAMLARGRARLVDCGATRNRFAEVP